MAVLCLNAPNWQSPGSRPATSSIWSHRLSLSEQKERKKCLSDPLSTVNYGYQCSTGKLAVVSKMPPIVSILVHVPQSAQYGAIDFHYLNRKKEKYFCQIHSVQLIMDVRA